MALALGACAAGGTGTRDEGPARTGPASGTVSSPPLSAVAPSSRSPVTERVDAVRLVKNDPLVSPQVKKGLRPCASDEYPVDVSYGNLTGSKVSDVVVNVMTCGDALGIGSYVYRPEGTGEKYTNVFQEEEPPVYAEIDRGDLVVTKQVYERGDRVSYPSGEDVLTYRWSVSVNGFSEETRTHNDFSNAVGGDSPGPADN